jgi:hypothetical protein
LEQISLAILVERGDQPAISLRPEPRRSLLELMAAAIIAVHRASLGDASKEGGNGDVRE